MADIATTSPLIAPSAIIKRNEIDLEAGPSEQIQCRICLETDGQDFIAPCKCKGTSKYVHRECLDHWRAVKEGFAFAHCTTCKARYHLRVHVYDNRKWQILKFRFFVTRDVIFIFVAVQLVITSLSYLVYLIDSFEHFQLRLALASHSGLGFYYLCGALVFFALVGLVGCFMICHDDTVRNDPSQPCQELCVSCCRPGMYDDTRLPGNYILCTDCNSCFGNTSCDCNCNCCGSSDEAGLPLVVIMGLVVFGLFVVFGIFYSVLVATMFGQRIWQRHYHIIAKKMLTKEYIVEDVDGMMTDADWRYPPRLPLEHTEQLTRLRLL